MGYSMRVPVWLYNHTLVASVGRRVGDGQHHYQGTSYHQGINIFLLSFLPRWLFSFCCTLRFAGPQQLVYLEWVRLAWTSEAGTMLGSNITTKILPTPTLTYWSHLSCMFLAPYSPLYSDSWHCWAVMCSCNTAKKNLQETKRGYKTNLSEAFQETQLRACIGKQNHSCGSSKEDSTCVIGKTRGFPFSVENSTLAWG